MKLIEQSKADVTVLLSNDEIRLIFGVLAEVANGPNAFDEADWNFLIGMPRAIDDQLREQMLPIVTKITSSMR